MQVRLFYPPSEGAAEVAGGFYAGVLKGSYKV